MPALRGRRWGGSGRKGGNSYSTLSHPAPRSRSQRPASPSLGEGPRVYSKCQRAWAHRPHPACHLFCKQNFTQPSVLICFVREWLPSCWAVHQASNTDPPASPSEGLTGPKVKQRLAWGTVCPILSRLSDLTELGARPGSWGLRTQPGVEPLSSPCPPGHSLCPQAWRWRSPVSGHGPVSQRGDGRRGRLRMHAGCPLKASAH